MVYNIDYLYTSKNPCIPGVNPTWSWFMILFTVFWILLCQYFVQDFCIVLFKICFLFSLCFLMLTNKSNLKERKKGQVLCFFPEVGSKDGKDGRLRVERVGWHTALPWHEDTEITDLDLTPCVWLCGQLMGQLSFWMPPIRCFPWQEELEGP